MTNRIYHPEDLPQSELSAVSYDAQGWRGYVLSSWRDFEGFGDLGRWFTDSGHEVVLEAPCRTITRIETERGVVYTKLMRAQNDGVLLKNERFSKFKWRYYPSRAQRIMRTTLSMLRCGHLCPIPLLGIRKEIPGGLPNDLFVATEITHPTVEKRLLEASSDGERRGILELCGRELAGLHRDGFIHGDFLPRNTCLSADNAHFYYLDNDRTHVSSPLWGFHFKRRNLTQFCFNLNVIFRENRHDLTECLIGGYGSAAEWNDRRLKKEISLIENQNDRRWKASASYELTYPVAGK